MPRLTATEQRLGRHLVVALGAVVTIMLGVSLEHLASGIREITHSTAWSAWALAIAIDVGMVASEVALIVLATFPEHPRRRLRAPLCRLDHRDLDRAERLGLLAPQTIPP